MPLLAVFVIGIAVGIVFALVAMGHIRLPSGDSAGNQLQRPITCPDAGSAGGDALSTSDGAC
jgi:hypothetical protein